MKNKMSITRQPPDLFQRTAEPQNTEQQNNEVRRHCHEYKTAERSLLRYSKFSIRQSAVILGCGPSPHSLICHGGVLWRLSVRLKAKSVGTRFIDRTCEAGMVVGRWLSGNGWWYLALGCPAFCISSTVDHSTI